MLPSVSVLESVAPSYARSGEGVLSLNVSNYRTDADAAHREVGAPGQAVVERQREGDGTRGYSRT